MHLALQLRLPGSTSMPHWRRQSPDSVVDVHVLSFLAPAREQVPVARLDGYQPVRVGDVNFETELGSCLACQLSENSFEMGPASPVSTTVTGSSNSTETDFL